MPDLNKTREILETAFINGWTSRTPIKFDNVKFKDSDKTEFVSITMINYTSRNVNVGSLIYKRIRHIGVLSVNVYIKQDIGTDKAYARAKEISDIMSNYSEFNIFTEAAKTRRNGSETDGWFSLIVDIPYTSDEE